MPPGLRDSLLAEDQPNIQMTLLGHEIPSRPVWKAMVSLARKEAELQASLGKSRPKKPRSADSPALCPKLKVVGFSALYDFKLKEWDNGSVPHHPGLQSACVDAELNIQI